MSTVEVPDFAALFAENSESNANRSWVLSPRTALALWEAADNLCHLACQDITDFGSAPYSPDDGLWWQVFCRYPNITWRQDELWRQHAAWAFSDLAAALAAGEWPRPQTAAEEMALWLSIEDAEIRVDGDLYGGLLDYLEALPTHENDYAWEDCRDYLFDDHDILFLFDRTLEGIEDPHSAIYGVVPDVADYRPQSWFEPFWGQPPRVPSREAYDQARARRAASASVGRQRSDRVDGQGAH